MLDEFGAEIEHADSRLDATMKKMAKVMHLSDGKYDRYPKKENVTSTLNSQKLLYEIKGSLHKFHKTGGGVICHKKCR